MAIRKHTRMVFCDHHRGMFMCDNVYRRVEVMVEGGWAHGGSCEGGKCHLYAGTDYLVPEVCETGTEYPLDWTEAA